MTFSSSSERRTEWYFAQWSYVWNGLFWEIGNYRSFFLQVFAFRNLRSLYGSRLLFLISNLIFEFLNSCLKYFCGCLQC